MTNDALLQSLKSHLAWWGIKRFTSDADYFDWQRKRLSSAELIQLSRAVEQKQRGGHGDEVAFYDLIAQPQILPVLYSQRYEYYLEIGSRVAARLGDADCVLDFSCGVGVLTTFYATQRLEKQFVGIDRSPASVAVAREKTKDLGLSNLRFECTDVDSQTIAGSYDLIIATHSLVQAEQDPGIPSHNWQTFERAHDTKQQAVFEQRTGIDVRLDRLNALLAQKGRMIVFEKTRQLARRVPLQRALAARDLGLIERLELIRYRLVEEVTDDGPFYLLQKEAANTLHWDESPEPDEGPLFDRTQLKTHSTDPDTPLYENHWPSAQHVWEQLHSKRLLKETTRQESDGRQLHVELGQAEEGVYLYCANTYDQRQLVMVEPARAHMLESYYQEIVNGVFG
ncbi:MAG: class I SAM-dependent methyltransferase [Nitrospiraceae bacterium]|nr:MAG: class I SAM-dependent methyltransferase [Nitrospiraceae bacterium]